MSQVPGKRKQAMNFAASGCDKRLNASNRGSRGALPPFKLRKERQK
jgi:hypothetical protein